MSTSIALLNEGWFPVKSKRGSCRQCLAQWADIYEHLLDLGVVFTGQTHPTDDTLASMKLPGNILLSVSPACGTARLYAPFNERVVVVSCSSNPKKKDWHIHLDLRTPEQGGKKSQLPTFVPGFG